MTAILLSFCSFLKLKRKNDLGWSSYTSVRKRKDQKTFDNRIPLPPTANMWNCLLGEVDMCREGYIGLFWNSLAGLPTFGRNFSWEYSAYYGSLNSTFGLGMMPVSKVTYSRGNIVLLTAVSRCDWLVPLFRFWLNLFEALNFSSYILSNIFCRGISHCRSVFWGYPVDNFVERLHDLKKL